MPLPLCPQYPGKALFCSSGDASADETVSGSLQQLSRVQAVTWDINYPLDDQVYLDAGIESYYATPPSVDVNVEWFHTNGFNERFLGLARFNATGTLIIDLEQEKNLYVSVEDSAGVDAIGAPYAAPREVLGFAQGVLTSYQLSASVGGLVRANSTLNCLSAFVLTGSSGVAKPSVNYQDGTQVTGRFVLPGTSSQYNRSTTGAAFDNVAAIGAQDMFLTFPDNSPFGVVFTGQQACYLQSFQLGLTINRGALKPLGFVFPPDRPVIWPIPVNLRTEAIVGRYQADTLRRLACTVTGQQLNVIVKQPCSSTTMFGFYFTDLQLVDQSFGVGLGGCDTVSTSWRGYLKTPSDTFISPFWATLVRLDTTGAWGGSW